MWGRGKVFGGENLNNRNKTHAKPRMRENYARLRRNYKQRTGMCLDLYQAIWGSKSGGHGLAVKWRTTDPQNGLTLTGSCLIFPLLSSLCNERAFTLHSFDPTDYSKNSPDQYLCGECMYFFFKRTLLGTFFFSTVNRHCRLRPLRRHRRHEHSGRRVRVECTGARRITYECT